MSDVARHDRKKIPGLVTAAILVLSLLLAAAFPAARAAAAEGEEGDSRRAVPVSRGGLEGGEDIAGLPSYYAPEVAEAYCPEAESLHARLQESVPPGMLPDSLRGEAEGEDGLWPAAREAAFQTAGGEADAAGTGGWTPLARAYNPIPDPVVYHDGSSANGILDNSGRMHFFFERVTTTDISQPPDGPGFEFQDLGDSYYAMYSEGAWSAAVNLTNISGWRDSELVYVDVDRDD